MKFRKCTMHKINEIIYHLPNSQQFMHRESNAIKEKNTILEIKAERLFGSSRLIER